MAYQKGTRVFNTPAHAEYLRLIKTGVGEKEAAKVAQERTGISLVTGKSINHDLPYKVKYSGQYR